MPDGVPAACAQGKVPLDGKPLLCSLSVL